MCVRMGHATSNTWRAAVVLQGVKRNLDRLCACYARGEALRTKTMGWGGGGGDERKHESRVFHTWKVHWDKYGRNMSPSALT